LGSGFISSFLRLSDVRYGTAEMIGQADALDVMWSFLNALPSCSFPFSVRFSSCGWFGGADNAGTEA
jgi:hypothetical protein